MKLVTNPWQGTRVWLVTSTSADVTRIQIIYSKCCYNRAYKLFASLLIRICIMFDINFMTFQRFSNEIICRCSLHFPFHDAIFISNFVLYVTFDVFLSDKKLNKNEKKFHVNRKSWIHEDWKISCVISLRTSHRSLRNV